VDKRSASTTSPAGRTISETAAKFGMAENWPPTIPERWKSVKLPGMSEPRHKFTIGRDRACDIPLADDSVSGKHAELSFLAGGKLLLTDCKSTNGTFLLQPDGRAQRLHQELISPLDRIKLGGVALCVRDLLEALRLKYPRFEEDLHPTPPPNPAEPWAHGSGLIRCACGTPRRADQPCPVCGR
jgi:hypothetical protein